MNEPRREFLYELLPVIYRQLDIEQGEPLRTLMDVIESEYRVLETDLDQLYNNWFIETCEPWVVPYIGDLLGIRGLDHEKIFTATERSRVANTIAYRRRKGTLTTLERAIQDATGWKAHVVEFFKQLSVTQSLGSAHIDRGRTTDVRNRKSASESSTPFNSLAHTIDVRSRSGDPIAESKSGEQLRESGSSQGKFNLGNVGIFLWRLRSYPVKRGTPRQIQPNCYSFSPLGVDWQPEGLELFPLFNEPLTETSIDQASRERNVPAVLSRSTLAAALATRQTATGYFGSQPVLQVFTRNDASAPLFESIAAENIVVRNLRYCRGRLLFRMAQGLGKFMDRGGRLHDAIRNQFAERGVSLAPDTTVDVREAGGPWLITEEFSDRDNQSQQWVYVLSKEENEIAVYDQSVFVLFSLDLMYVDYLQAGAIKSEVRGEFVAHGISLSSGAQVAIQTLSEKWLIADADGAEQKFLVIKEGSKLNVYDASIRVAIDPQLGRLAFPSSETPAEVRVSYSYGLSMDIGGGPYDRRQALACVEADAWRGVVSTDEPVNALGRGTARYATLRDALVQWAASGRSGVIQIADNGIYELGATDQSGALTGFESIEIGNGQALVIEAADGVAPCLLGGLSLIGKDFGARVQLNGLLMEGAVLIAGYLDLDIQHCTLKPPGQRLAPELKQSVESSPGSLVVNIGHSIVGRICLPGNQCSLSVHHSIVDGGSTRTAISGLAEETLGCVVTAPGVLGEFGPPTTLATSTIFGRVAVRELAEVADVIFRDQIKVQNQQAGSMRYSYVPPGSETPERYRCQPDLALMEHGHPNDSARVARKLRPSFTAEVFGHPAYAQLELQCPREIQTGAENGSEMGVFNQLYQPQRRAELGLALAEYLPFGQAAGIFYVN